MIHIDSSLIEKLSSEAKNSERKRKILNFHTTYDDPLQRMINAIEPTTYCVPHKHENPDKREVFLILKGAALVVEYDDNGTIIDHIILNNYNGNYAVEIREKTWHSIIALEPGTVVYEVKDGPYDERNDKVFANWAPSEGSNEALSFIKKIVRDLGIICTYIK